MTDAMTRILEESKVLVTRESTSLGTYQIWMPENLPRFAELIRADEREACAVIAFNAKTYIEAANAIRARGQS